MSSRFFSTEFTINQFTSLSTYVSGMWIDEREMVTIRIPNELEFEVARDLYVEYIEK